MTNSILVLGGSGFIGRHLVETLAKSGESVIAATKKPSNFAHPSIENVAAAFDRPDDFAPLLSRSHVVVHASSSSTPGSTAHTPLMELDGNLRTALSLLTALQGAQHCSLLYLSSGGTLYGDRKSQGAIEADPLLPRSYHGAAKASVEHFINAWSEQHSAAAVVLRPSNVYGPGQAPRSGFGIIPAAFESSWRRSPLTLWGDGSAVRDYIYIDDFIRLCLAVLSKPFVRGIETYNAASGESVSLLQLMDAIRAATGLPLECRHEPSRALDIQHITPNNAAVVARYGWEARTPLREGLQHSWSWFTNRR